MTVKELKEKLEQFPENCVVLVPNENLYKDFIPKWYVVATNVARGTNGMDGYVIIDDYVEDEDE
jgi:hypothetical protein